MKTETKCRQSVQAVALQTNPPFSGNKADSLEKVKEGIAELMDNQGFLERLWESRRIK